VQNHKSDLRKSTFARVRIAYGATAGLSSSVFQLTTGESGWPVASPAEPADVWMRGHFGWEFFRRR
jgi:hypothetical protein